MSTTLTKDRPTQVDDSPMAVSMDVAARKLGVSVQTIERAAKSGAIRTVKILNRRRVVPVSELERLVG